MTGRRGGGLQLKIVAGLLVIAAVPLAVSAILIGSISEVAQNFASNEVARLEPALARAQTVYRELVSSRKAEFAEVAQRLASSITIPRSPVDGTVDISAAQRSIGELLRAEERLSRVAVVDPIGQVVTEAFSTRLPGDATGRWRDLPVSMSLGSDGYALAFTFVTRVDFLDDYAALGRAVEQSEHMATMRAELPSSYRTAFLLVVGGVVVVVTGAGIVFARRMTRRIETLAAATRSVAAGQLATRVEGKGRDELAELAASFNTMIAQLERDRSHIEYLHKIGAWQDVARKLAHEIKNPLTPIQLAVQQVASTYRGDDERFAALLKDTEEIVGEEIDNLRRLVDAFRSLGRLPQAELDEIDVAVVVDDLQRDPIIRDAIEVRPPAHPVSVRADRLLLRHVLANLIENGSHAARSAGREGPVVVSWRRDGDVAVIEVDDCGAGVDARIRSRMFDPYVTTKVDGSGLGLAISKKIVLDHGGTLDVGSEPAPTGGAKMIVTLPLAAK